MPQPGDNSQDQKPADNPAPPADDNKQTPPAGDQGGDGGGDKKDAPPAKGSSMESIDLSELDEIEEEEKQAEKDQKDTSAEGGEKKTTPSKPAGDEDDAGDGSGAGDDDKGGEGDQKPEDKPKEGEEDKPKDDEKKPDDKEADTTELDKVVEDVQSVDLYEVPEDKRYSIYPITDPPDPKEGQSFQEYFKAELLPRVVQAITNKAGIVQRNFDLMKINEQKQADEEAGTWVKEINELKEAKAIPAYELTKDGILDMNSEGGKVVKAVFEYMADYNAKNPNEKIKSFKMAHKLWKADTSAQEQHDKQEQDDKSSSQTRREQSRRVAGSGSGTNRNNKGAAAPGVFKGMRLDDIEV